MNPSGFVERAPGGPVEPRGLGPELLDRAALLEVELREESAEIAFSLVEYQAV